MTREKTSGMNPQAGVFRPSFLPQTPEVIPSAKYHSPGNPTKAIKNDARHGIQRNFAAEAPFKREMQRPKNSFWEPDVDGIAKRVESSSKKSKKKAEWLYIAAFKHFGTVSNQLIEAIEGPMASAVSDFSVVCSYNWSDAFEPTIFVPGGAAKYKKPSLPIKLDHDQGIQYIDHNVYRNPVMPFEPMMRAASIMDPSANFHDVEIVISRGGLQNLFDFARGKSQKSFRVELDLVNNTLFIAWRKEVNCFRMSSKPGEESWGHAFEEAFTKYDAGLESSVSHQRVIQYNIGEMKCLVRHEVDGAYYGPEENATENDADVEAPSSVIQSTPQNNTLKGKARISSETKAIRRGQETPPSAIMELKARPRMEPWEAMNQMYFGRTPHLVIGQHEKGEFTGVRIEDCEPLMEQWEWENHEALTKLASLLGLLRENAKRARAQGRRARAIYNSKWDNAVLEIWTTFSRQAPIPPEFEKMFWIPESESSASRQPRPIHGQTRQRSSQGNKPWKQRKVV
ncbi:geranylgeranyl pyrophosphate synthetase [Colletotrichum scovillei]|nr:geranylgeranyl pyrophosphate synthetase [Colletotrichum scovillei]